MTAPVMGREVRKSGAPAGGGSPVGAGKNSPRGVGAVADTLTSAATKRGDEGAASSAPGAAAAAMESTSEEFQQRLAEAQQERVEIQNNCRQTIEDLETDIRNFSSDNQKALRKLQWNLLRNKEHLASDELQVFLRTAEEVFPPSPPLNSSIFPLAISNALHKLSTHHRIAELKMLIAQRESRIESLREGIQKRYPSGCPSDASEKEMFDASQQRIKNFELKVLGYTQELLLKEKDERFPGSVFQSSPEEQVLYMRAQRQCNAARDRFEAAQKEADDAERQREDARDIKRRVEEIRSRRKRHSTATAAAEEREAPPPVAVAPPAQQVVPATEEREAPPSIGFEPRKAEEKPNPPAAGAGPAWRTDQDKVEETVAPPAQQVVPAIKEREAPPSVGFEPRKAEEKPNTVFARLGKAIVAGLQSLTRAWDRFSSWISGLFSTKG